MLLEMLVGKAVTNGFEESKVVGVQNGVDCSNFGMSLIIMLSVGPSTLL